MQEGDATLAWVLFWAFAAITTVASFLITDHHKTRSSAIILAGVSLGLFVALYLALQALLRHLGL